MPARRRRKAPADPGRRRRAGRRRKATVRRARAAARPGGARGELVLTGPVPAEIHAHIVCRGCGRIAHLALVPSDYEGLVELTARRPRDWALDGVAYSLTGTCPRCRTAPAT